MEIVRGDKRVGEKDKGQREGGGFCLGSVEAFWL